MSHLYGAYKTSSKLETSGIIRDFGFFRVTIARAGGSNQKFNALIEKASKEHGRALANGLITNDRARSMMATAYAEAVILNWETNVGTELEPEWKQGIEAETGELLPFNKENVISTLLALPDLFNELVSCASDIQFFRQSLLDGAAKN